MKILIKNLRLGLRAASECCAIHSATSAMNKNSLILNKYFFSNSEESLALKKYEYYLQKNPNIY